MGVVKQKSPNLGVVNKKSKTAGDFEGVRLKGGVWGGWVGRGGVEGRNTLVPALF